MALGIKIKTVTMKQKYTIEELFEAVKDKKFTAGEPQLVKHGFTKLIVFPALDNMNQVQISPAFGKNKFTVQKAEEAGMGNMLKNSAMRDLTGGFYGLKSMVGDNAKKAEELVTITAAELDALGL